MPVVFSSSAIWPAEVLRPEVFLGANPTVYTLTASPARLTPRKISSQVELKIIACRLVIYRTYTPAIRRITGSQLLLLNNQLPLDSNSCTNAFDQVLIVAVKVGYFQKLYLSLKNARFIFDFSPPIRASKCCHISEKSRFSASE